jgi:hypothetical protein
MAAFFVGTRSLVFRRAFYQLRVLYQNRPHIVSRPVLIAVPHTGLQPVQMGVKCDHQITCSWRVASIHGCSLRLLRIRASWVQLQVFSQ